MSNTYTLLETITVGAAGASSVTFNSIPQTGYTDLVLKVSWRTTAAVTANIGYITFNADTTGYSHKFVQGNGATADSGGYTGANSKNSGIIPGSSATANTFSNNEIYIPNYRGSTYKSYSIDSTGENNATTSYAMLLAGLWSNTAAITSIKFEEQNGATLAQYSTFSLYGVSALGVTPTKAPKATGGSTILTDGTYWYHTFLYSGTFTPATALSCDVLVVAGGGGGGGGWSAGGAGSGAGAGGYRTITGTSFSTAQTVTIGAGGTGGSGGGLVADGTQGSNSVFGSITSAGGGKGAGQDSPGYSGGSGSGAGGSGATIKPVGGAGNTPSVSPVQGYAGGDVGAGVNAAAGGGGGSSAVGSPSALTNAGGNGGAGTANSISGTSVTYAAGGKGGGVTNNGAGVAGGPNTGDGGAGNYGNTAGGAGGSGIVIVRYLAA
jgi:hypothetical protein